ncbi:hypothetical protein [Streptomyces sp. SCL15-4]|uniref:hypothetical protein n=1 Tax=Streptomyces sp. SCL15-4 TaxID=2967221 RepID=UPI002966FD51|nr:hypothetical protein [Streptomyces sp. SCL15-4]
MKAAESHGPEAGESHGPEAGGAEAGGAVAGAEALVRAIGAVRRAADAVPRGPAGLAGVGPAAGRGPARRDVPPVDGVLGQRALEAARAAEA